MSKVLLGLAGKITDIVVNKAELKRYIIANKKLYI